MVIQKNCYNTNIKNPEPFLARVIIAGKWDGKPNDANKLLRSIYQIWLKEDIKVKFLITCGGFIQFNWPSHISKEDIGDNLYPNPDVIEMLVEEAENNIKSVLTKGLCNRLKNVTDYITIGIDGHNGEISDLSKEKTQNYLNKPHIELVCLIDLRYNEFYWTGKSYPTSNQERGLVRITNLKSHFLSLGDDEKVMILGCHDLNIFNPRSKNAKKDWRRKVRGKFRKLAQREKPTIVLHHPHSTVKVRTWLNAWRYMRKLLPSVKKYAGAGRYYESWRKFSEYDPLNYVLPYTKCGDTIDYIVRPEIQV